MQHTLILCLIVGLASAQSNFKCPKPDGLFPDVSFCDRYYDCFDDLAEVRVCPDGLVFDPLSRKREPCDHYFNVDCEDRLQLQEPQGTNDLCPRLNGFYAHPEPSVCNVFYACVDGVAEEYTCSPGLYFDEYKGVCNWPLDSERTNCNANHALNQINGFSCPELSADSNPLGLSDPHPKHADADDCAKFYICLNGVSARSQGCELGLVYNDLTKQCDSPENVAECKDYYAFLEDEEDNGKVAVANRARK